MDALSPVTRRIVAVGLLVLVSLTVANLLIVPLFTALHANLGRLGDVRFERAQTEATADRAPAPPAPPIRPGLFVIAANPADAGARLAGVVRTKASAAKVAIISLAATAPPDAPGAVSADIAVAGSELEILAFLKAIESDRLLMRLVRWHIQVDDAHRVQLDGRISAAWGQA